MQLSPLTPANSAAPDPLGALDATQTAQSRKAHGHHHREGQEDQDDVQLSTLAQQLASAPNSAIAQLQSAIGSGTYNVSPSQIANSLINFSMG